MSLQPTTIIGPPWPDRRSLLAATGAAAAALRAGCHEAPSSGGPPYETPEIADGPVDGPGPGEETERDHYSTLVTGEDGADSFDWSRPREADRAFVEEADFRTSCRGLLQVPALNSPMRFGVVDLHESDVTLAVVAAELDIGDLHQTFSGE